MLPVDASANPVEDRSMTTLSSREVYRNHWMRVREDEVLRANGEKGIYGVVEKHDAAIILAIEKDGTGEDGEGGDRIWLVEQFRYTIGERSLELPQGGWEMEIEDPEELARGELREETGMDAVAMTRLGMLWIAYGFTRQKQYVYLATGLTPAEGVRDAEECDLTARMVPISEFERMMREGTIRDSSTLAAWGLYQLWKAERG
jgi:8-oxo-dGTP pyrophosphatase MutT (NUDIX family)